MMPEMTQMLTQKQALIQQSGGTWSELFDRASFVNANAWVTVLVWLAAFWLLGLIFLPMTSLVFGAFHDKGYGISRFFGLMICGYAVWLAASLGFSYTRSHILIILAGFVLLNSLILLLRRGTLIHELRASAKSILAAELVFLLCFAFFLLIRLGNPDLWHPYKGGERPMDFSYFNAILKSTTFPPYDPWFAGGYLNYYYYGIYLSGVMVKLLGIVPSVAFNLILPLWYAFLGSAAYSLGNTLYGFTHREIPRTELNRKSIRAGIFSVVGMQVLGNLGTVKQMTDELMELGSSVPVEELNHFVERASAFFTGIAKRISGQPLHMYKGDWYWIPSRAIPDSSITEFPFFTFLYGDPHAHLFALPMTVLVLLWLAALIIRCTQAKRSTWLSDLLFLTVGAFLIAVLIPTNTWDMPTYLCISLVVVTALGSQYGFFGTRKTGKAGKWLTTLLAAVLLVGLTFLFVLPYSQTNSRENIIEPWDETHTPVWSYLMHWGLFLFMILSWYIVETRFWMAETPWSACRSFLRKHQGVLIICAVLALSLMILLQIRGVSIVWVALPLMIWSLILFFRPRFSALQRFVILLIGTSLFATLLVELIHLAGDYGRMNTVFKFYNQVWVMLSLCAAYAFACTLDWLDFLPQFRLRPLWNTLCILLIFGCALYTGLATVDKVTDRMSDEAPHTLDGMKYMQTSTYWQDGFDMDLSQDYDAIIWMQENIQGSPVIVEANATEYKFGSRYTMYTGLPGVVGWNYHQRQQRTGMAEEVWRRVNAIGDFYNTDDPNLAQQFLARYSVKYIIVGQMERGMYEAAGIAKFEELEGSLWHCIYEKDDTQIYEVN